jgi:hypothetical protein
MGFENNEGLSYYHGLLECFIDECGQRGLDFRQEMGRLIFQRIIEFDDNYMAALFDDEVYEWLREGQTCESTSTSSSTSSATETTKKTEPERGPFRLSDHT